MRGKGKSIKSIVYPPTDKNTDPLEILPRLLDEVRGTAFPGIKNCLSDGPMTQRWGT